VPGHAYRREDEGKHIVETAQVLKIAPNKAGIPHVYFNIEYRQPYSSISDGPRVMALESFRQRYRARVFA
jgi:hypothetical protein